MPTIRELAQSALDCFVTKERPNGSNIWTVKDLSPRWVHDLVFAAHDAGEIMPDDWRYRFVVDALIAFAEVDDPDDAYDAMDEQVDIETSELLAWVSSRNSRVEFVDEAVKERDGWKDMISALQGGQYGERNEVFGAVRLFLEQRIAAGEDDDDLDHGDG